MTSKGFRIFAIVLAVLTSAFFVNPRAFADEDFLFGPEFTFWIQGSDHYRGLGLENQEKSRILYMLRKHLIDGQPDSAKFTENFDGGEFSSPNGWSFTVEPDPSVVEVTMFPMTAARFAHFADDIQDAIFVTAANAGLFPSLYGGGGHINLGGKALTNNPLLLLNFVIDWLNHNELALGIFNYDTNNALPFDLLPTVARRQLLQDLEEFAAHPDGEGLKRFVALRKEFSRADGFWGFWHRDNNNPRDEKYHALSFRNMSPDSSGRIEIRAVRAQASMDVWVRQIRLIEKRLQYLQQFKAPLKIAPRLKVQLPKNLDTMEQSPTPLALNPPVKAQEALRSFYIYVTESGETWSDHRDYIWPKWIADGELEKFEQSSWFKKAERAGGGTSCSALLGRKP